MCVREVKKRDVLTRHYFFLANVILEAIKANLSTLLTVVHMLFTIKEKLS